MMVSLGRNSSPIFKLINYELFDEVHIFFHFNIIPKHSGVPYTKQSDIWFAKKKHDSYESWILRRLVEYG
jgi:hypothetical protein